jgi:hypothetical protein
MLSTPITSRTLCLGLFVAWIAGCLPAQGAGVDAAPPQANGVLELTDLEGRVVRPFASTNAAAQVFVFVSNDCPICNRYAPELGRLEAACRRRGIPFWLVHPLLDETPDAIRRHAVEYSLPKVQLRDGHRSLSRLAGITVTPEAALFDRQGRLVYRGRIDDRFPALGRQRPAATRHDLLEAIEALLGGKPIAEPRTPAVGCVLPDRDENR